MTAVGDVLFFQTGAGDVPRTLWKTDGTAAGTVPVAGVDEVTHPTSFRSMLVFAQGGVVWRSDGTAAGTQPVAPITMREDEYLPGSPATAGLVEGPSSRAAGMASAATPRTHAPTRRPARRAARQCPGVVR